MPNHLHALFLLHVAWKLEDVLHGWKLHTARHINKSLGRRGQFWQHDYFDRLIRDGDHLRNAMRIADTAARLNQPAFAVDCYETLITAAQLRLARQLSDLTPGHEDNAYRAHYFALLTPAADLEAITPRLQAENDLTPAQTARRRLLWAMLAHRRSQPALIAKELHGIEQATIWIAGERAVLAGLLAASGETARAFALAEKVPASLLLPEEAALLKLAR
jgi:hypothetical protein